MNNGGIMLYLITDCEDKTLGDVQWSENATNEQTKNPNYLFSVYNDPIVAHMLNAAYEGYKNPNIWIVEGEIKESYGFRHECMKLKSIKKLDISPPSEMQRICFAILCSIHLVSNRIYKDWVKNYLSGANRTKEEAENVMKLLSEIKIGESDNHQDEYVGAAIASLMAVTVDANMFTANAAHRSYYDSPLESRINLEKLANIAVKLSPEDLASVLS